MRLRLSPFRLSPRLYKPRLMPGVSLSKRGLRVHGPRAPKLTTKPRLKPWWDFFGWFGGKV